MTKNHSFTVEEILNLKKDERRLKPKISEGLEERKSRKVLKRFVPLRIICKKSFEETVTNRRIRCT